MRIHSLLLGASVALCAFGCSNDPAPDGPKDDAVVEGHPGSLVITSPARAAMIEGNGAPVEVKGSGATKDLTINGAHVDVAPDGTFHTTMKATPGLDVVVAIDGDSRVDTPFLYGHFLPASTPVPQAVAIDLGKDGLGAAAPAASLASITNRALAGYDLMGALKGQTFTGSMLGATFSYEVSGGKYGGASVAFSPASGGLGVVASVTDVVVDGTLTISFLGQKGSEAVQITADRATIEGNAELSLDAAKGALGAAMPQADATLDGFHYDSNNAGLPCCVDDIVTSIIEPKVEAAIRDAVKNQIPKSLALTLDGMGLPKQLDLSAAGVKDPVGLESRFDGAAFDEGGGSLTASLLFGGRFAADTPGGKAPGWLTLAHPRAKPQRPASIGISFSLDAANQLFFAAWGTGSLARTIPDVATLKGIKLTPALPPVLSVADSGALRVGLGEIVLEGTLADEPIKAAITVQQDIAPSVDGQSIVLTPKGEPNVSITWLQADDVATTVRNIIAAAAKDQVAKLLEPMRFPFPTLPLDKLGKELAGKSLAIQSPAIAVDGATDRLGVSGTMALVP